MDVNSNHIRNIASDLNTLHFQQISLTTNFDTLSTQSPTKTSARCAIAHHPRIFDTHLISKVSQGHTTYKVLLGSVCARSWFDTHGALLSPQRRHGMPHKLAYVHICTHAPVIYTAVISRITPGYCISLGSDCVHRILRDFVDMLPLTHTAMAFRHCTNQWTYLLQYQLIIFRECTLLYHQITSRYSIFCSHVSLVPFGSIAFENRPIAHLLLMFDNTAFQSIVHWKDEYPSTATVEGVEK